MKPFSTHFASQALDDLRNAVMRRSQSRNDADVTSISIDGSSFRVFLVKGPAPDEGE
jgi:hypothetical protein